MNIKKIKTLTIITLTLAFLCAIDCNAVRRGRGGGFGGGRGRSFSAGGRGRGFSAVGVRGSGRGRGFSAVGVRAGGRGRGFSAVGVRRGGRGRGFNAVGVRRGGRGRGFNAVGVRRGAFVGPRRGFAYRGRWRGPGFRRRGWWIAGGWRRSPWRTNWWAPGAFWWRRPIFIGEPYWIDDRLIDETGATYWKVFNGTNNPLRFSSYDGSVVMLNPGEAARVWRGESFSYAVVTPGNELLYEGKTSEHYIMLIDEGYSVETTNNKDEWLSWKR